LTFVREIEVPDIPLRQIMQWTLGVLALAVFAALMEAAPYIGPFVFAMPAVLIALTISPTAAPWLESIESSDVTPELRNLSQRLADLLAESQSTRGERQAPSTANLEPEPG
jgi:hypothetical protein